MPEYLSPDENENQEAALTSSALAILNQSEHAAMVQTANVPANRRKLLDFESKLMSYANHSQPVALLMFYSLPRAGKQLIGPSVRFSEIVAPCWKNCAVAGRVIGDASNTVTAQGVFLDYEVNLRNSVEVPRRITGADGRRYSDDMIVTTSNAAMSVARRNAVLKGGVPQALWTPSYEAAQLTAVGKNETHAQRVASAMDYLHKMGLSEWQVLNAVGVPGIKELETEHLVTLRVLCAEIKRGDKTIDEVFGSAYDKEIDALFVQLKMNASQQRLLRTSYLGRAQELAAYLRDRMGPQGRTVREQATEPAGTTSTGTTGAAVNTKQGMAETKVYSDGTTATGIGPLPDQSPAQQEGESREEFESDRMGQTGTDNADKMRESAVNVGTADGGTSTVTVVSGGTGEPPRRGRGRPTREEMARRRAQEQGGLEPVPEPTEEEARREVEDMVEQTDQFAF